MMKHNIDPINLRCSDCGKSQSRCLEDPECNDSEYGYITVGTGAIFRPLPIGDIVVSVEGKLYVVDVSPDETAIRDLWLLMRLLFCVNSPDGMPLDVKSYLDENGLWRFFTKKE